MSLASYILRRVVLIVPTLFGVSILTFVLSRLVPGDPARLAAGAQATPEMYEQIRREFGLDDPLPVQYWNYLTGLVQGDWGRSILSRRPVLDDLAVYWPATFELVVYAMVIAVAVGIPLGILAAVRADRPADQLSRVVALLGVSVPAFWLAILLQIFFGLRLGWLPVSGRLGPMADAPTTITGLYTVDGLLTGNWATLGESLRQILLPAITLSFPAMATIMRFTRATLLETLGQDYVRTARAKGATERRVVTRHALRNALIPTITMIGLSFGWAMGGSVLVETVFDWPGIGLYATKSALSLDFLPIMGIALLYGLVFSIINILVDVTYGALDPPGEPHVSVQGAAPSLVRGTSAPVGRSPFGLGERQRRALRQFRQSPLSMVGLAIIFVLLLIAVVGPAFVPYPDDVSGALNMTERLKPPSAEHLFGTDQAGRDVFTRVIAGARVSLLAGLVVIVLALTVGTLLGAAAGFFGGRLGEAIMRTTDIFLTIPDLILAMAFAAALGPGLFNVMIAVSLVWWPGYCRLARANVVALRDSQFAESARSVGASQGRVLFTHILPNAFPTILVKASMDIGFAVLTTAALGFIGLGTQPPTPDWGVMIADGRKYLREAWWFSTFPGIAILLTVLAFNLLGDGLRDVMDPRARRRF